MKKNDQLLKDISSQVQENQKRKEFAHAQELKKSKAVADDLKYRSTNYYDLRFSSLKKTLRFEVLLFGIGVLGVFSIFYNHKHPIHSNDRLDKPKKLITRRDILEEIDRDLREMRNGD